MRSFLSPVRLTRSLIIGVLSSVLTACVTMTASDPLKTKLREDESTVVVSVTSNSAQFKGVDSVAVEKVNSGGRQYAMNLIVPGMARDTSVFVGTLPEGEYEFAEFIDRKSNWKVSTTSGTREKIGRFKVIRGQVIDLGRLIMTPANYRVIFGRSTKVSSNQRLLEQFAPEYAALFRGKVDSGWLSPIPSTESAEEYALWRTVGFDNPVELADGTLLGASRMGTVLIRSPIGKWRTVRTGGLESLLCVLPVSQPDATLIAVGEFNTMQRLRPGDTALTPIDPGNLPAGNLLFVAGNEGRGWYVAQQQDSKVTIYFSHKLEKGDWQPQREETVGKSFWNGANQIWFWHGRNGFSYAVSDGRINHLNFDSGAWSTVRAPKEHRITDIYSNPDDSIGILTSPGGGFGGIFAGVFLSQDQGVNWKEITPKYKIKISPPLRIRPDTMMTISRDSAFTGQAELHLSHDDGATWTMLPKVRLGEHLVPLRSGRILSVSPGNFGVFSISMSSDEGQSWPVEYSNFDSALYEAQQRK